MDAASQKPDYGIDAPGVVRNLAIAGAAGLIVAGAALLGWLPPALSFRPSASVAFNFPLVSMGISCGIGFAGMACWMYFGSRYGKIAEREKLLDRIAWRGDEQVLDVGCGKGLLLIGAAKRLKSGKAVGVDIWQKEDLSGNSAEVPLRNAAIEGVADRVAVKTADMRELPFPDGSFDAIVSRAAIHNLYSAGDRAKAIAQLARVLKPGGRAVINDIRHLEQYVRVFAENGCRDARLVESRIGSALLALVTMGSLRPNTLLVRKAD